MKKFRWRLQRLLDLKVRQEDMLRAELVTLMEKTAALRGRIMMLRAMLRSGAMEIRSLPADQQVAAQRQFLEYAPVRDRQIVRLREQLDLFEQERKNKMDELARLRKFRKGLERLREKAADDHARRLDREEQKFLDESSNQVMYRKKGYSQERRPFAEQENRSRQ